MRYLTEFLGIDFDDILLVPTFNKFPIKANKAFKWKVMALSMAPCRDKAP
jgi:hypothetical protein